MENTEYLDKIAEHLYLGTPFKDVYTQQVNTYGDVGDEQANYVFALVKEMKEQAFQDKLDLLGVSS